MQVQAGAELIYDVPEFATVAFQVAAANSAGFRLEELLTIALDRNPLTIDEVAVDGNRVHLVDCGPGVLTLNYTATVEVATPRTGVSKTDALVFLRQSRFCPSDQLEAFARAEFADDPVDPHRIGKWVFDRIAYTVGSSDRLDTAVDTLLANEGVCRDFAHLTVALCRALGIPARVVSVYAPGLTPMDFHAVAEVAVDGAWQVVDPTRMAPRETLLRIATGRDASDTAFADTLNGYIEPVSMLITATTDADLPLDDHAGAISIA